MLKQEKKELSKQLQAEFDTKNCMIVLSHKKITFSQIDKMRNTAKEGTILKKIPNRIAKKALSETSFEALSDSLKNENIFVFGTDSFDVCKTAFDLRKDNENVSILKGASKQEGVYSDNIIDQLASIGSEQVLQSKLLNVINGLTSKLIRLLQAKEEK